MTPDEPTIEENLPLLRQAIQNTRLQLMWLEQLEAAIERGDEAQRMQLLHEAGFQDPELFPEATA